MYNKPIFQPFKRWLALLFLCFFSITAFSQKRIDLSLNSAETNDLLVVGMTEKLKVNLSNLGNETFPACKLEVTLIDNSARNTNLYKQVVFSAPISALQMNQNLDLEFDMPIAKTIALKSYKLEVKVGTEASFGDLNQENNYIFSDVTLIDPIANLKKVQADYYMGGFAKPLLKDGKPCDCIEMTTEANNQKGQVYSFEKLDLNKDVILEFAYYFGTRDGNGADGQVFILHNDQRGTAAVGDFGEGMGYGFGRGSNGLTPSIAIEMDTWQNGNRLDPVEDHIAFLENGNVTHNDPNLPMVKLPNIEDGKERLMRFEWYAATKTIKVYFDKNGDGVLNVSDLMFEIKKDLIAHLGTDSPVWGVTAGTGGSFNQQYFCNKSGDLLYQNGMPLCDLWLNNVGISKTTGTTAWNTSWDNKDKFVDFVTVNLKNINPTKPVQYTWKLTFPSDASGKAGTFQGAGVLKTDGTHTIEIPYPAKGAWGDPNPNGSGLHESLLEFNISTPCGGQSWTHSYKAPVQADLEISKTAVETAKIGDEVSYKIVVKNKGVYHADKVVVTDILPDGVTLISATSGYTKAGNVLTWNLTELLNLTQKTFDVKVRIDKSGLLSNKATVKATTPDFTTANNSAVAQTQVGEPEPYIYPTVDCQKVKASVDANGTIVLTNDNIREVIVSYQIIDKAVGAVTGQKGTLTVNANGNRSLGIKAPTNGSINFFMGASNFAQIMTATNGVCLVKNGTKTVEIGTKVDQYAIFENKAYDARNWDWFVRKEKVALKDKFGKLATDSDKGVSLKDLTTITNETNLFVASQTGAIGFTHAVGYFRIVDNKPVEPQIVNWKISNMSSGSGVVQGTIPANSKIGFFLVASGASSNPLIQNPNSLVRFVGTTLQYSTTNGASWIDIPQGKVVTTIKEWNTNQKEMAIAGIAVENNKTVLKIGFEDNTGSGSDWDYEDHVLTVHFNGIEAIKTKESKILQTVDHLVEVPCGDCSLGSIKGEELLYESLKCDEISCNKDANGNIIVENKNSKAVTVNYKVVINGKENSKGTLKIGGQSSVLFNQPAPVNGYVSFGIGSDYFTNVISSSNILGDVCLVADGKKFISAGEREVQYEVFEGKTYDAREWAWFVRQEQVRLKDRFGKTVQDSDKGVTLHDLTTSADEVNMLVKSQTGQIGFTHTMGWFKIVNGQPVDPKILVKRISGGQSTSANIDGTIPKGTQIGFFLVATNAGSQPLVQNPDAQIRFVGTTLQYSNDGTNWTSIPKEIVVTTIKDWNFESQELSIAGLAEEDGKVVLKIGIEDWTKGDYDYEDHVLTVFMSGVSSMKTKIVKFSKEVDNLFEVPCGSCEKKLAGETLACTPSYMPTSYKLGELYGKVVADRKIPVNAEIVDLAPQPTKFLTLGGLGGEVAMDFGSPIAIVAGSADLLIAEVSYGKTEADSASYPEKAEVWVSQDGAKYVYGGLARLGKTSIDLDSTKLKWFRYVKLKDKTPSAYGGDGFDLNYMSCLNGAYTNCFVTVPVNLHSTDVKPCCVYFAWDEVAGAMGYKIAFRDAGSTKWQFATTDSTHFKVQGLPGMDYTIKVAAFCENGESAYSEPITVRSLGEPACDVPTNPRTSNVTLNSARVLADAARNALGGYEVMYRALNTGNDEWTVLKNSSKPVFDLVGLEEATIYEYQVKTVCTLDGKLYSAWTEPKTFKTCPADIPVCDGCPTPTYISIKNVEKESALVSWNKAANIENYEVMYRTVGASRWTTQIVSADSAVLTNLISGMKYETVVRTICDKYKRSEWLWGYFETQGTPGCGYPQNIQVIDRVQDIEGIPATITTVSWSGDNTGVTHYEVMYRLNGNDATKKYLTAFTNQVELVGLLPATYEFWIRAMCPYGTRGWNYHRWIKVGVIPCATPDSKLFTFETLDQNTVKANWISAIGAFSYQAMYRPLGSDTWKQLNADTTTVTMSKLYTGTDYQFQVRSVCETPLVSNFSGTRIFRTEGDPYCPAVKNIQFVSLLPFCMTATWEETAGGAIEYQVQYAVAGTNQWQTRYVTKNLITVTELEGGKVYDFRVRAICEKTGAQVAIASPFLNARFTALGVTEGNFVISNGREESLDDSNPFVAYPNPFESEMNFKLLIDRESELFVYDVMGRMMSQQKLSEGRNNISVSTEGWSAGMYVVRIVSKDGAINRTAKMIKQ